MAQARGDRHAQFAVEHYRLRIYTFPMTHRELRVIAYYRAYAHQNAIVQTAQLVGELQGLTSAECQGFITTQGYAAVQTLGIAKGDEGSLRGAETVFGSCQPLFNFLIGRHETGLN